MNISDIINAVNNKIELIWLDPSPIKNNNYTITYIEDLTPFVDLSEDELDDLIVLIKYGNSEAEVLLSEIVLKN